MQIIAIHRATKFIACHHSSWNFSWTISSGLVQNNYAIMFHVREIRADLLFLIPQKARDDLNFVITLAEYLTHFSRTLWTSPRCIMDS